MTAHHSTEFVSPDDPRPLACLLAVHRPIEWYPGCYVGSDGGTWSRRRPGRHSGFYDVCHPLRQARNAYGYLVVCFGPSQTIFVHRLVLMAFVGPQPPGLECRHFNGRRDDNRLDNLAWGTTAEQVDDKRRHGTIAHHSVPGERNGRAGLTEAEVWGIRDMAAKGYPRKAIQKTFGLSESRVRRIVNGEQWRTIGAD